jgi:hypothetical protein
MKMMAAATPEINGEIIHDARIWASPDHPQSIPFVPRVATPTPTIEPTMV